MTALLVVDDDKVLCTLLKQYLEPDGFEVDTANNGNSGLAMALSGLYRFVVLDVMLPGLGGFEVLRRVRKESNVPVLMLTARGADTDRILGLEYGADDYLPKPFNPQELTARIRAIHRRTLSSGAPSSQQIIEIGRVRIDVQARHVTVNGQRIELTSVEFLLLEILMRLAGSVVPRERLSKHALGRKLQLHDRSLDIHISRLRQKLGDNIGSETIQTARKSGYIFVTPSLDTTGTDG
jgi:two-component system response regulator CpxR